jgi:4-hydroxy-3-methylbut-2-enyl diphosphate reductase
VAARAGCERAFLIQRAAEIDFAAIGEIGVLGITAGASAPEILVEEVIDAFAARYDVTVESVRTADETITFNLPRELRAPAA